jgi:hypothetical protein
MPVVPRSASAPDEIRVLVEEFLAGSKSPALLEPGEELFPFTPENFTLEMRGSRLTIQAWDRTRNITRSILGAQQSAAGRLELTVERFAKRHGAAHLLDLARRTGADAGRRGERLVFRRAIPSHAEAPIRPAPPPRDGSPRAGNRAAPRRTRPRPFR